MPRPLIDDIRPQPPGSGLAITKGQGVGLSGHLRRRFNAKPRCMREQGEKRASEEAGTNFAPEICEGVLDHAKCASCRFHNLQPRDFASSMSEGLNMPIWYIGRAPGGPIGIFPLSIVVMNKHLQPCTIDCAASSRAPLKGAYRAGSNVIARSPRGADSSSVGPSMQ